MTDPSPIELSNRDLPAASRQQTYGPSLIWLIPLLALAIAGWLGYKTLSERGPTITLTFHDGSGLEAGKTKIKYKSVDIGVVDAIRISPDLTHVIVTAKLQKDAEALLKQHSKFWIVRPRVGIGGISGLETLITGAFIELEPGSGKDQEVFTGLERPPVVKADTPGRKFILRTDKLGAVQDGSPILFRDIRVGEVLGEEIAADNRGVLVHAFIYAPHYQRINNATKFWKTGAVDVSMREDGLNLKMGSLSNMLTGGISFDTTDAVHVNAPPSTEGKEFALYESFESIGETSDTREMYYRMYFDRSVRGLDVGASVEFRGIRIGRVTDIGIQFNDRNLDFKLPVTVALQLGRFTQVDGGKSADADKSAIIKRLVERGLRARLQPASLITGKLFVNLDIYPQAPARKISLAGDYPQLPTLPSELDEWKDQATDILADLRRLPLHKIANELLGTLQGTNRLANSDELTQSVQSFNQAAKDLQVLIGKTDSSVTSVASSTEKTMAELRKTLGALDEDSPVMVDLVALMKELTAASQAFRNLSEYLERHPEALIQGKGKESN